MPALVLSPEVIDAVIFDLDGVVTDTARVHMAAWRQLFDEWFQERGLPATFSDEDYRNLVDGRRREDGVVAYLASRSVRLPPGDAADPPERDSVVGLGRRKDAYFLSRLASDGPGVYASTVHLVDDLRRAGVAVALVTASRNANAVLAAAELADRFVVRVDGHDAAALGLPGKPDPAVFLEAARRLGVTPERAAVVEDAVAGVQAGRRGGFGLVLGVDRTGHADALLEAGADVVVPDLDQIVVGPRQGASA